MICAEQYICSFDVPIFADFNKHTHGFLGLSVPRMFKSSTTGEAMPVESESMVGEGVDFDKIELTGTDGEEKIFKYVQEPLRKWLANFDTVVVSSVHGSMPGKVNNGVAC